MRDLDCRLDELSIHSVNEILLDFQGFIETEPQSLNAVYCCFSSEATMPKSIGFGSNRMILIAKVIYVAWCHNHIEKYKRKGTYLVPVQCRGLVSSHPAVNGTPVEVCNSAIQAWRINAEMNNYGFTRKKGETSSVIFLAPDKHSLDWMPRRNERFAFP